MQNPPPDYWDSPPTPVHGEGRSDRLRLSQGRRADKHRRESYQRNGK